LESQEIIDNIKLAIKADRKPDTSNPLTKVETNQTRRALIIKTKSPRVKILMGKVKTIRMGLIKALRTPKNKATTKAV